MRAKCEAIFKSTKLANKRPAAGVTKAYERQPKNTTKKDDCVSQ